MLAAWGIRRQAPGTGLVWRGWLTLRHCCWRRYEINSSDSMAYLSEVEQQRVKQALVVLAAFRTLLEHPYQVKVLPPSTHRHDKRDASPNTCLTFAGGLVLRDPRGRLRPRKDLWMSAT